MAVSKCTPHVINTLEDLDILLGDDKENVCTKEKAEKIKEFYHKYLDTSDKEVARTRQGLPQSLIPFALAYGMQVNNLCKKKMVKAIMNYATENKGENRLPLTEAEYDISRFLESAGEPGDVLTPDQLCNSTPTKQAHNMLYI